MSLRRTGGQKSFMLPARHSFSDGWEPVEASKNGLSYNLLFLFCICGYAAAMRSEICLPPSTPKGLRRASHIFHRPAKLSKDGWTFRAPAFRWSSCAYIPGTHRPKALRPGDKLVRNYFIIFVCGESHLMMCPPVEAEPSRRAPVRAYLNEKNRLKAFNSHCDSCMSGTQLAFASETAS